jgi:CheY-like chemotaxis protein
MTSTDISTTSKAIMVVDDEADIVIVFDKSLSLAGYEVFSFTDPVQALEHFKMNPAKFGLIISDIRMPNMNGIEFATKVREMTALVPVILMSAFEMTSLEISPSLNITRFVQKPIMPAELRKLVAEYVPIIAK